MNTLGGTLTADPRAALAGALPRRTGATPEFSRQTQSQLDFAAVMSTQDRGLAGTANLATSDEAKARRAAEDLVSITLVQPMLEMARDANQAPPPFGPGEGEKTFGKLLDAQISRSIVRGSNYPLVDRLARDMLKQTPTFDRLPTATVGPVDPLDAFTPLRNERVFTPLDTRPDTTGQNRTMP